MSTPIIIIFVIAIAIVVVLALRGGGPRVTTIERTVDREEEGDER